MRCDSWWTRPNTNLHSVLAQGNLCLRQRAGVPYRTGGVPMHAIGAYVAWRRVGQVRVGRVQLVCPARRVYAVEEWNGMISLVRHGDTRVVTRGPAKGYEVPLIEEHLA